MTTTLNKSRWMIAAIVLLALVGVSWFMTTREAVAETGSEMVGRDWSTATAAWGHPACRAAGVQLTARESAARRAQGQSALMVPHPELVLLDPSPVHGRGSRVSNRVLVFTDDPEIRSFIGRHVDGDLASSDTETRIAIERARPVRLVEIDPYERILGIRQIRPVFLTVLKR